MRIPKSGDAFVGEHRNTRFRETLSQAPESGGGHDRITQPVDSAYQQPGGFQASGWGGLLHLDAASGGYRFRSAFMLAVAPKMPGLPAVMHPKPIGRVPPDGRFEGLVYLKHNRLG